MGPVRGYKKRRKIEANDSGSCSKEEGSVDWWAGFSSRVSGLLTPSKGLDNFKSMFNVSTSTFDYISSLVKEHMMAKPPHFMFSTGKPMSLHDRVAMALRRLGSGDSLIAVADMFGTNHSTVSQVTWRFVEAIEQRAIHNLQWPSTEQEMRNIKSKFEKIQGLPNCCGAIGTTHITMLLPSTEMGVDMWRDREKKHSVILQAIVDPTMRFLHVATGFPGKMDNFSVLRSSNFFHLCEKGERLNGCSMKISKEHEAREYIVGDSGFPLLPWLITSYQGKVTLKQEAEFNKRHSETHQVAQKALARLKERWRIIEGVMWRPDKHRLPRIVLACCILHNIVIDLEHETSDEANSSHNHDTGYRPQICEFADKTGLLIRDRLCLYLWGKPPP